MLLVRILSRLCISNPDLDQLWIYNGNICTSIDGSTLQAISAYKIRKCSSETSPSMCMHRNVTNKQPFSNQYATLMIMGISCPVVWRHESEMSLQLSRHVKGCNDARLPPSECPAGQTSPCVKGPRQAQATNSEKPAPHTASP
jgi:hypothetical protein